MPKMIEHIFIFGVILPALVTVILFVGFLICWFKCDLREKIIKKCFRKKNSGSSNNSQSGTASRGIHYIKDNLDTSSSNSKDRHNSGSSANTRTSAIPMHDQGDLANMGFEIEEDFKYIHRTPVGSRTPEQVHSGPVSTVISSPSHHTVSNGHLGGGQGPTMSSSPVDRRSLSSHNSERLQECSSSDNGQHLHDSKLYSQNTTQLHQSHVSMMQETSMPSSDDKQSVNYSTQNKSESNVREQVKPWGIPSQMSQQDINPAGVHKSRQSQADSSFPNGKRSQYIQQVFQFSHSGKHLTKLSNISSRKHGISLDNSSSSYSSSNEGDYYDREGDYGHFVHISQSEQDSLGINPNATQTQNHALVRSHHSPKGSSEYQQGQVMKTGIYYPNQNPAETKTTSDSQTQHKTVSYRLDGTNYPSRKDNIQYLV